MISFMNANLKKKYLFGAMLGLSCGPWHLHFGIFCCGACLIATQLGIPSSPTKA